MIFCKGKLFGVEDVKQNPKIWKIFRFRPAKFFVFRFKLETLLEYAWKPSICLLLLKNKYNVKKILGEFMERKRSRKKWNLRKYVTLYKTSKQKNKCAIMLRNAKNCNKKSLDGKDRLKCSFLISIETN